MNKTFTIFVGFVHDFAAGCWAATLLAVYWLSRQAYSAEVSRVIFDLKKQLFWAGLVSVAVVFATGTGRTFTYVDNVYGQDAEKRRFRQAAGEPGARGRARELIWALVAVGLSMYYNGDYRT